MDSAEQRRQVKEWKQSHTCWQLLRYFDLGSRDKVTLDEPYVREMAPVVKAKTGIWVRFKPTTWERGPRQKTRCAWKEDEGQDDSPTFLIKDSWKRQQWGEGQQQSLQAWTAHGRPKHRPQVQSRERLEEAEVTSAQPTERKKGESKYDGEKSRRMLSFTYYLLRSGKHERCPQKGHFPAHMFSYTCPKPQELNRDWPWITPPTKRHHSVMGLQFLCKKVPNLFWFSSMGSIPEAVESSRRDSVRDSSNVHAKQIIPINWRKYIKIHAAEREQKHFLYSFTPIIHVSGIHWYKTFKERTGLVFWHLFSLS